MNLCDDGLMCVFFVATTFQRPERIMEKLEPGIW